MQAIVTKYIGPANVKGSRVKATASAGSITLHWDDSLNADQNHCAAAKALALKFGWNYGTWQVGGMPNSNDRVWICADRLSEDSPKMAAITSVCPKGSEHVGRKAPIKTSSQQ